MLFSSRSLRSTLGRQWLFGALAISASLAAGCDDGGTTSSTGGPTAEVTFHKDVEPILHEHCLSCHSEGKIGGFSLVAFEDAAPMAGTMAAQTESRLMPPWGAQDTDDCHPRLPWKDDARLSDEEIATLRAWADAGAPEGDPADAPPAYEPPPDGLPDASMEIVPQEASVIEGDKDLFTCVVYDPKLTEDKWVDGIHFIADNSKVAHHALTFRVDRAKAMELSGGAERFPCFGGAPGDIIHVWAPGGEPFQLPDDVGIKLTADQVIVVQMHYHPTRTSTEEDKSKLQLRFRDQEPSWEFFVTFPGNAKDASEGLMPDPDDQSGEPEFRIPAGSADHVEKMKIQVPSEIIIDLPLLMVMPHMHYVGTSLKMEIHRATLPAAQPQDECLVDNPAWNFGWQRFYQFDVPINELPTAKAGDEITITCHYNNTKGNIFVSQALEDRGLSEPVDVFLGEETLDEMCLVPVGVLVPAGIL
jgi:hypothetical protein